MKVFPVVHVNDRAVAVEHTPVALGLDADGVYLISHGGSTDAVLDVLDTVRLAEPGAFLGVTLLDHATESAPRRIHEYGRSSGVFADGLWSNDILQYGDHPSGAMQYQAQPPELAGSALLGGAAFTYTLTYTDDPTVAAAPARQLEPHLDVATTSGPGTRAAPPPEKITAMKHAVAKPLAVASGIGLDTIGNYAGSVDQVVVASTVETEPYSGVFHAAKLAEFITVTHDTA